ncbi:ATP-binding protein [Rubrivirga sp. IMCC45206]|uniref:ATP-binding protein n=1 Tax=Rubrivirga sp. IMCC45206 TaxID=3391614 RepID=UPI00398FE4FC
MLGIAVTVPAQSQSLSPALDARYLVAAWGSEDGLPLDHTTGAAYGPDGLLWVSTYDGVVRFDGLAFHAVPDAEAAPSRRAAWITTTGGGEVWVGFENGAIGRYREGRFDNLTERFGLPPGRAFGAVEVRPGAVWIPTRRGLWEVQDETAQPVSRGAGGESGNVRASRLGWIADAGGTFVRRLSDGSVRPLQVTHASNVLRSGRSVQVVLQGELYISDGQRLASAPSPSVDGLEWEVYRSVPTPDGPLRLLLNRRGGDGRRLWATYEDGAYRVRRGLAGTPGEFHVPVTSGRTTWDVSDGYLRSGGTRVVRLGALPSVQIVPDGAGGVWVTGGRLLRVRPRRVTEVSGPNGPLGNTYPVLATRSGDVWAGTWSPEALVRVRGEAAVETETISWPTALAEGADGDLWLSAYSRVFRKSRADWREVAMDSTYAARTILETDRGDVWIGHTEGALVGREGGPWRPVLRGVPVVDIEPWGDGVLLATQGRGILYATRAGVSSWLRASSGLASDNVRDVTPDPSGGHWVATEDAGLCRLRGTGGGPLAGRPACLGRAEGLPDVSLHRVLPDGRGRLWVTSNRGVFWIDRDDAERTTRAIADGRSARVTPVAFSEHHGMPHREANGAYQPAGSMTPDGRFYVPTQAGVAVFDTGVIGRPEPPPALVLSAAGAGGEKVYDDRLDLAPGERDLSVRFTAAEFDYPESVQYRVRLVGYDDGWRDPGDRREAVYTNLPPGDYTFQVQAGLGGAWGGVGEVAVVRAPHWWETWAFRVGAGLAALLGLGAVGWVASRARVRALEQRQRELEATVDERTAALRRANEAKTRFLVNVSHELRTPLALVLGPLDDLRRGRFDIEARARPLLDRAAFNGRRLRRLVDDLLTLARLDADAVTLRPETVDLGAFVRTRVAAFRSRAATAGLDLSVRAPASPVVAAVDPAQLETALYNVIANAVKFTPDGGRVAVRVGSDAESAVVVVEDDGPGIAPDDLDRLFDRFYQGDTDAARRGEGTGIGLSLVREIVELHGGAVDVESTVGEGTTVTLRVPRLPDVTAAGPARPVGVGGDGRRGAPPARPSARAVEARSRPATEADAADLDDDDRPLVLVVEDHPDLRAYLRTHLDGRYRVAEAADGAEGIERARDLVPDLVLTDLMMPEVDGLGVLDALKRDVLTSHVPVVLLTARADAESQTAGFEGGADAYLAKPFDADVLLARVGGLIAQRRALRALWAGGASGEEAPAEALPPAEAAFLTGLDAAIAERMADATFGVAALADALALSPRQLRRKLAALTDESPVERLRRARVERAAELLAAGRSVKQAQREVGFTSASGFRTAFHAVLGVAPADAAAVPGRTGEGIADGEE